MYIFYPHWKKKSLPVEKYYHRFLIFKIPSCSSFFSELVIGKGFKGKSVFSVLFEIISNFKLLFFFKKDPFQFIFFIMEYLKMLITSETDSTTSCFCEKKKNNFLILCVTNLINLSFDVCKKRTCLVENIDVWRTLNNLNSSNVNN